MAHRLRQNLRGIAAPVLLREPLLIRACSAFVNNLTLILRTAFIVGAIIFVQDLRGLREDLSQTVVEPEPLLVIKNVEIEPIDEPDPQEPMLSERVKHFLNCTYDAYRSTHFDECVAAQSNIYQRPQADPDDRGSVTHEGANVRYAWLDDSAVKHWDNGPS